MNISTIRNKLLCYISQDEPEEAAIGEVEPISCQVASPTRPVESIRNFNSSAYVAFVSWVERLRGTTGMADTHKLRLRGFAVLDRWASIRTTPYSSKVYKVKNDAKRKKYSKPRQARSGEQEAPSLNVRKPR